MNRLSRAAAAFLVLAGVVASVGCSSGVEDEDGSGGGGTGGGEGGNCPSALDCDCLGGSFTQNECGGYVCHCPATCNTDDECPDGFCLHSYGNCTDQGGYCTTKEAEAQNASSCSDFPTVCGCDGALYANRCEAAAQGVSPSRAPISNCAAEKVACSDAPGAAECFLETQYCHTSGSGAPQCRDLDDPVEGCTELTCECVAQVHSTENCTCSVNEAGFVLIACTGI